MVDIPCIALAQNLQRIDLLHKLAVGIRQPGIQSIALVDIYNLDSYNGRRCHVLPGRGVSGRVHVTVRVWTYPL